MEDFGGVIGYQWSLLTCPIVLVVIAAGANAGAVGSFAASAGFAAARSDGYATGLTWYRTLRIILIPLGYG